MWLSTSLTLLFNTKVTNGSVYNLKLDMEEVLPYFLKAKYKKEDNFFYEHQDYFENLEDIFGDISQE